MASMLRRNWFLVVPTFVLGIWALVALHGAHERADVRKALDVVRTYEAAGRAPLGELVADERPGVVWETHEISGLYGTFDVVARAGDGGEVVYRWRVDILQRAFAPADEPTSALMRSYAPEIFSATDAPATDAPSTDAPTRDAPATEGP